MAMLPFRTRIRGPAAQPGLQSPSYLRFFPNSRALEYDVVDPSQPDILDETLDLFRANSLFRNFEIKGPADRILIVLILFISDCLSKISASRVPPSQIEATKSLNTLAVDAFPLPGDATFPLNAHYAAPSSRPDAGAQLIIDVGISSSKLIFYIIRVATTILDTSASRISGEIGGTFVR
jgi:actin related protein 2/3 complex subunit 3